MNQILRDKFKASLYHLLASAVIVLISLAIVWLVWYPYPLALATGVLSIFVLVVGVDLVLGPALTFLVFKRYKRTLKFDLTIIALIQLAALCYGMYSIYQGRPVWIAYVVDRFEVVRANEVVLEKDETIKLPYLRPTYVDVDMTSSSVEEQLDRMLVESIANISPAQQPKYHQDFSNAAKKIQSRVLPLEKLLQYNSPEKLKRILDGYSTAIGYVPLKANYQDMSVLVDDMGVVLGIVNLRPWD